MSAQGNFMIFCAEQYKLARRLTGRQLAILFEEYGVWEYVYSCYEALHTTGVGYIIEDIDSFIQSKRTRLN